MKNIIKISCFVGLAFLALSCNKMLDVDSISDVTDRSFYNNTEELNAAVIGCYSGLQKTIKTEWMFTEIRSDNSYQRETGSSTSSNIDLDQLDMLWPSTDQSEIYNYWYYSYQNIASANAVLEHLDVVDNADLKKQFEAEVRFIRAYHHFNLVRLFGPIFIMEANVTPQEAKKMNRRSMEDVYDFIITDLEFAQTLPDDYISAGEQGRATKWAAMTLLAKVYMTLNRFDLAKPLLLLVEGSSHNTLSKYEDVFSVTNEMNIEIIFAVRFLSGGYALGSSFSNDFAPLNSGVVKGRTRGLNSPSPDLYNSYDPTDLRRDITVGIWRNVADVEYLYPKKLVVAVADENDSEQDFIVLRYADVLLMLAECENELNGPANALPYLDGIRTRAGLGVLRSSSQMEARLMIENERRFELAFENHRFFDLVRTDRFLDIIQQQIFVADYTDHYVKYSADRRPKLENFNKNKILLPIPRKEIVTNNDIVIAQNIGY